MTMRENDDIVLDALRRECAKWAQKRPGKEADLPLLYALRDEALSRELPLPDACPVGPSAPGKRVPQLASSRKPTFKPTW